MRARNIKPSFFTNPDLGECSPVSRLCFAGLWCCADREGRIPDRPRFIKAQVFPYDSIEVEPLLLELERFGFIERYEVGGVGVISIPNFTKHQRPHVKEKSSELPGKPAKPEQKQNEHLPRQEQAPTQASASTDLGTNEPALNPECGMMNPECGMMNPECGKRNPECGMMNPECGKRNPECGKRNEEVPEPAPVDRPLSPHLSDEEFSKVWSQWLGKQASNRGRRLDDVTEQAQLYSLSSFDVEEATEIVRYSVSRTDCKNLILNGDHKSRDRPAGSANRRTKVSFDEGLLK